MIWCMAVAQNSRPVRAITLRRPRARSSFLLGLTLQGASSRWLQLAFRVGFGVGVAVVIIGSLLPADRAPAIANDKLEHFLAYAFLSLLGSWMFQTRRPMVLLALSLCALAILLEIAQRFSPGRSTEVADALVSGLGACSVPALRFLISFRSR